MSTLEELEHDAQDENARKVEAMCVLIAKVIAWQDGIDPAEIDAISRNRLFMDAAQQCAEDLGWA
jgi:hypothetical protein